MVSLKWRMRGMSSEFSERFPEESVRLASVQNASRGGSDETAARLYGSAAFAAQRTVFRLIAGNRQVEQRLGLDRKFNLPPAPVDQCSRGDDAPTRFFHDLNRLLRRAAGCPDIFNHKNVLVGLQ